MLGAPIVEDCVRQAASSAVLSSSFNAGPALQTALYNLLKQTVPAAAATLQSRASEEVPFYTQVVLEREIYKGVLPGGGGPAGKVRHMIVD